MTNTQIRNTIIVLFVVLAALFYFVSFADEVDKIFLTISTFLFSIFTGFFISRQGGRYSKIREMIASFDGKMSAVYRISGHLGEKVQSAVGHILKSHYKKILDSGQWDYYFTHKSSTITDVHKTLEEHFGGKDDLSKLEAHALGACIKSLIGTQEARKQLVALHQERIPQFHWILIYFFMVMLLATVATIPSVGFVLGSILKAAFAASVISVIVILKRLDTLKLFEGTIGEHSAQDVVAIIDGKK